MSDTSTSYLDSKIERVEASAREDAAQMRKEMAAGHQSLRQEFQSSINSVMSAIRDLGQNVSERSKPQYALLIAFGSLCFTSISGIGFLAMRSYDVSISEIKSTIADHNTKIVPRTEIEMLAKDLDKWIDRFNVRLDRLSTNERQDAIDAAIARDRLIHTDKGDAK